MIIKTRPPPAPAIIIPRIMPSGAATINPIKTNFVYHNSQVPPLDKKVVPNVHATGILWTITLIARTVISDNSLKTPIASPSTTLCKIKATPNASRLPGFNLYLYSEPSIAVVSFIISFFSTSISCGSSAF